MLLKVLLFFALLAVFFQDRRYRAVYWWMYPILTILLLFLKNEHITWPLILEDGLYNLVFIGLQLFVLSLYFSFKNKKLINITQGYIGWGDILFFVALAFYLSPFNFAVFYLSSLIVIIFFLIISGKYKSDTSYQIPLAGWQSVLFLLMLLLQWQKVIPSLTDDYWLVRGFS